MHWRLFVSVPVPLRTTKVSGNTVNVLSVLGSIGRCTPVLVCVVTANFLSNGVECAVLQSDAILTFNTAH